MTMHSLQQISGDRTDDCIKNGPNEKATVEYGESQ